MKKSKNPGYNRLWIFKLDLKMKISFLFLFAAAFMMRANSSYSQNTKVSLDFENVTVAEVIDEIEAATKFKFLFNVKEVNLERNVSINVKKERIKRVLNILFFDTRTSFEIDNRKILLFKNKSVITTDEKSSLEETTIDWCQYP